MGIAQIILTLGPVYRGILSIPALTLENAMACRVYRAVILGIITDGTKDTAGTGIFTTVLSEINDMDDVVLQQYKVDMEELKH